MWQGDTTQRMRVLRVSDEHVWFLEETGERRLIKRKRTPIENGQTSLALIKDA